jgi:hypothetical protein
MSSFWLPLGLLILTTAPSPARCQDWNGLPGQDLMDSALYRQATAVLERYGTTFYALGVYRDSAGVLSQFTPESWPHLDAPPRQWEDSLRHALLRLPAGAQVAAYLIDDTRPMADAEPASGSARRWVGRRGGACQAVTRTFEWDAGGRVHWGRPVAAPCAAWPKDSSPTGLR